MFSSLKLNNSARDDVKAIVSVLASIAVIAGTGVALLVYANPSFACLAAALAGPAMLLLSPHPSWSTFISIMAAVAIVVVVAVREPTLRLAAFGFVAPLWMLFGLFFFMAMQ